MRIVKYDNKPFKPPRIVGRPGGSIPRVGRSLANTSKTMFRAPATEIAAGTKRSIDDESMPLKCAALNVKYYTMTYRKRTMKKNKTWDGDGYAIEKGSDTLRFYTENGRLLGSYLLKSRESMYDDIFSCSGWEFQLDYEVSSSKEVEDITKALGLNKSEDIVNQSPSESQIKPPRIPISKMLLRKEPLKFKSVVKKRPAEQTAQESSLNKKKLQFSPVFDESKIESPLIMNKSANAEVDVVLDPILGKNLRAHQRLGLKFMYDCVMGLSRTGSLENEDTISYTLPETNEIQGCLLADEMGLGKTLMTIALIWTLLRQTPYPSRGEYSQSGVTLQGVCSKILIVCPVTLIGNWKKEFAKWLNLNRIGVLTLSTKNSPEKDRSDVRNFLRVQRTYQVLILGYEKLLSLSKELEENKDKIGLLVCDEGHRLKNSQSKILNILTSLDITRKVLLSGTPIQNDLNEFYTIVNFLNPGILGTISQFKKEYINPISRARDVNNRINPAILSQGEEKSKELIEYTKRFILRRTSAILAKYLPPKTDIILFCKPTDAQIKAFQKILSEGHLNFDQMSFNSSLGLITLFKKICNSPSLIYDDTYYKSKLQQNTSLPNTMNLNSGKLRVLMILLSEIRQSTDGEKVVVVSNYTQTLDIIENFMQSDGYTYVRLDGNTPNKQRDSIVSAFNRNHKIFGFLLSAKSGGVGLNLIGASRLILFDNDWNPSVDLQAMSRIHRDGQKRPCYIYRLITTGCIDEKIFQRQLMKTSLSKKFLDDAEDTNNGRSNDDLFDKGDLKDLFSVHANTVSNTHELICTCSGLGERQEAQKLGPKSELSNSFEDITSGGWTNALELRKTLDNSQADLQEEKSDLIRNCLVGYRHIHPKKLREISDQVTNNLFQNLDDEITFAFFNGD
ncbi:LAFE_0E04918g1_1 [Lachancea fermentati]|uniref:DNA repair and recombination protein RDH54 n=1 Tax=Lachancea fermentati TaxID=4955 RepID=A0A1G4MD10_LACFM|nr:LAFE_0E04918g1_1 [Lachancea fermentati]